MEVLKARRGYVKGAVTRIASFCTSITPQTALETLQSRLEKLNSAWSDFFEIQAQMCEFVNDPQYVDQESENEQFETNYYHLREILVQAINAQQTATAPLNHDAVNRLAEQQNSFLERFSSTLTASSTTPTISADTKLPKLEIPVFSGNYSEWISFRDLFTSTVHSSTSLTNSQKLHYLKSFLSNEAAALLRHIPVSDANYEQAWERLTSRYDKQNQIVKSFIRTFVSLPSITNPSATGLRRLTDGADEVLRGLKALGTQAEARDPWLIYLLLNKVDPVTRQDWSEETSSKNYPTIHDLINFLEKRCLALEDCQVTRTQTSLPKHTSSHSHVKVHSTTIESCLKCSSTHSLFQCPNFHSMDIASRRKFVNDKGLCYNCLRQGHNSASCTSQHSCRHCSRRHHTLVHLELKPKSNQQSHKKTPRSSSVNNTSQPSTSHESTSLQSPPVISHSASTSSLNFSSLLPTAIAHVSDCQGNVQTCRLLLDSGSQVSFVTEAFVNQLGLTRTHAKIPVSGLSSSMAGITRGRVQITIRSRINNEEFTFDALILSHLTTDLPSIPIVPISKLDTLELADPTYHKPNSIDMVLGVDVLFHILDDGRFTIEDNHLVVQFTKLGWIVAGRLPPEMTSMVRTNFSITSLHNELDIDKALQRFWQLEEVHADVRTAHVEDQAEKFFRSTVSRASDGKYIVELPFQDNAVPLGNSYQAALTRLRSMERRFTTNHKLKAEYVKFMDEYLRLGHMEKVPVHQLRVDNSYYLPHHAVLKPGSSTTKLRVVFDGSSKTSSGYSLNDALLTGPSIQRDLFSVCLRFRQHRFVFTADLEKMYRQIWVAQQHQDFQRIIWRTSSELPLEIYRLRTVTYGTSPAPFLAVRVLQQLAVDYSNSHPNASKILLENCYVDDILVGANSIDGLIQLKDELVDLLGRAGFNLRKWSSNCWTFLSTLPDSDCEFAARDLDDEFKAVKTLGLRWLPSADSYSFVIPLSPEQPTTKRILLSDASRIFDPLGFLTPVTVLIKILFQSLWLMNINWDDPVPASVNRQWLNIRTQLSKLQLLRIPRCLIITPGHIQLHGFSDASEKAFAAVIYCRCQTEDDSFKCRLVVAKSRVAPLKQISIARLELCGALLLSRLFQDIRKNLSCENVELFAWSDSQIVLHWLSAQPRRWSTFIGNRTSEILSLVPHCCWRYVPTDQNPADLASRGMLPTELLTSDMWWSGPTWLQHGDTTWPKWTSSTTQFEPNVLEEKKLSLQSMPSTIDDSWLSTLLHKYSRWMKLIRVIAYCIRFCYNKLKRNQPLKTGPLEVAEIERAKVCCLRHIQQKFFASEIRCIKEHKPLKFRSQLAKLSPFIDDDDLLRVGGRLHNSELSFQSKHPIILPKSHFIVTLIVRHYHFRFSHAGISELFTLLRQEFWILGCRNIIRKVVHSCLPCFRQQAQVSHQLMGQLPSVRVNWSPPFSKVGCDYAGPISLRNSRGRNPKFTKGYICLFICMTSKAIHLELVGDLTTDAFLAALRRFIARRGKCSHIYSDNGTNFKGAQRKLSEMYKLLCSETHNTIVHDSLSQDGISWSFNPPNAPHFEGLWEAGVKSLKSHLKRVIGTHVLTFEEMYTVLTQIEALLNSRPLFHIPDTEFDILTPFHLLTGHSYTAVPEPNLQNTSLNRLSSWFLLQGMLQGFWKRWHSEYLTSLQQRPKWCTQQSNMVTGDLVLLKEANLPPAKWVLARVVTCHPGQDGLTRVVTVRTPTSEFIRPITKLVKLPVHNPQDSSTDAREDVAKC